MTSTQGINIADIKEIRNKDDCFQIYYTDKIEVYIEYYNRAKLDAFFQGKIKNNMLKTLFEASNIRDIFYNIISAFNSNNYSIKDMVDEKNLKIIYNGKIKILGLKKVQNNIYFASIFKRILNEKEKEINNLKSQIENLKKKLKEYNNNGMKHENSKINITINEFNSLYHTSINLNGSALDLGFQNEGNDLLKKLSNFKFNCLKELNLRTNQISNINPFTNMNLDKLQTLNLYKNQIQDLSPLKNANLQDLIKINLQKNNISDISPLIDLNCINLQILLLDNNQIEDIIPLTKVKFNGLQTLTLDNNIIKDISLLEYVPFKQLKILSLHHNKINDIRIFNKIISNNLMSLESLWIYKNYFENKNNDNILNILSKSINDFL